MKSEISIVLLLIFVSYIESAEVYPNFVESLHLNPIKFPDSVTTAKPPPPPPPAPPKPTYPNFLESLHLNPIKFPDSPPTTAKAAVSGLAPIKFPTDAKPPPPSAPPSIAPPIQPRIGLFYAVPIYDNQYQYQYQ